MSRPRRFQRAIQPESATTIPTPPFTDQIPTFTPEIADYVSSVTPPLAKPPLPTPGLVPVLTQEIQDKQYRNFTIDLTTAHTNLQVGLQPLGIVADSMTIIQADSAFTYTLNATSNDATPAKTGQRETEFIITEIYVTNAALTGQAVLRVVWNPNLIRIPP